MSLQARIVWYLSVVVLVWAGLHHVVQKVFVMRSFTEIEEIDARRNLERVKNAIEREKELLATRCTDWASADGMYRYALERDARFVQETFPPEVFGRDRINLLYVCDMKGRVLWGRCVDGFGKPLKLAEFPSDDLGEKHPLIVSKVGGSVALGDDDPADKGPADTGVWLTDHGALLVSAKPILDSRGKGPVRGTVVVGRMLTNLFEGQDQYLQDLQRQTEVQFEIWSANSQILDGEGVSLAELVQSKTPLVRVRDDALLRAYTVISDVRGQPGLIVCATLPRVVTAQGNRAVLSALISTVAAGALFLLVLLRLLQQNVIGPIGRLTAHAVEIGKSEDPTKKLELARTDEIGILSREFDSMMDKLAQSRAALVKAARHAGMSEIATGVLHNVGNVLNSVNVSATLVVEKTRNSGVSDLRMAMQAVRDSAGDLAAFLAQDPRGAHLYPLLVALTEQIGDEQSAVEQELKRLTDGIDHIKLLIQSQQNYAGHSAVLETTSVADQLEAALAMTSGTVGEDAVEVVREYEPLPACRLDRHRLTEILVNLVQNARQALQDPELAQRRLTLRVRAVGADRIAIDVEDTGVGIPTDNLERVFVHGFTTKKHGHGFGLHASANAATEMGGSLQAHSDGPGRGARFTLEFPVRNRAATGVAA